MSKFTPGPWKVKRDDEGVYVVAETLKGMDEILDVYVSSEPETREADAHLIAAAPKMYEALRKLKEVVVEELLPIAQETNKEIDIAKTYHIESVFMEVDKALALADGREEG